MYHLLMVLSLVNFSLSKMQQEYDGLWQDSSFSLEEIEEYDPGNGLRMACELTIEDCGLKNIDDYQCRFRHHHESSRGGWFMDVYIEEKESRKPVCIFELNRQTKELKQLKTMNNK